MTVNTTVEVVGGIIGVLLFIGTLIAVPKIIRGMPYDYFVRPRPKRSFPMKVVRNVLGGALVLAGIAMLLLPGPGIVALLLGLSLVDLALKDRVIRWLLSRPKIQEAVHRYRAKVGKQPLVIPA